MGQGGTNFESALNFMDEIVDRLYRNGIKRAEFRILVRLVSRRNLEIYFARKYGGQTLRVLGLRFDVSTERIRQCAAACDAKIMEAMPWYIIRRGGRIAPAPSVE